MRAPTTWPIQLSPKAIEVLLCCEVAPPTPFGKQDPEVGQRAVLGVVEDGLGNDHVLDLGGVVAVSEGGTDTPGSAVGVKAPAGARDVHAIHDGGHHATGEARLGPGAVQLGMHEGTIATGEVGVARHAASLNDEQPLPDPTACLPGFGSSR